MKLTQLAEGLAKNKNRSERVIHKYFMQKGRFRDGTFYYPHGGFLFTNRAENDEDDVIETVQHFINGNGDEVFMMHFTNGDKRAASNEVTIDVWQKVRNP